MFILASSSVSYVYRTIHHLIQVLTSVSSYFTEHPGIFSRPINYVTYVAYLITVARLEMYGVSKTAFYKAREGLYDRNNCLNEGNCLLIAIY